jgi:hypothetical protein
MGMTDTGNIKSWEAERISRHPSIEQPAPGIVGQKGSVNVRSSVATSQPRPTDDPPEAATLKDVCTSLDHIHRAIDRLCEIIYH